MRTAKAAGILAAEMKDLQRYWEAADTDEMKALAAVAMLLVIPDGLETLRMQMVLDRLDRDMAADVRKNLQQLYDHV